MGLGPGTNKFPELLSLKLLLLFVGEKGVRDIQVFGDSLNVIIWIQKTQDFQNIQLILILEYVFRYLGSSDTIGFRHVYREHNMDANSLSKEGLQLDMGQWLFIE